MGHPKMNGSAPSLDVRISSALASDVVDRAALVSLLAEAHDALGMVQNVIVAETPRLHDLSNEDPNASLDLINRSKLRVERLEIAIPKLHGRIKAIEAFEYRQRYHTRADALRAARDELAEELAESYLGFLEQITNLYARIDKNSAAIDQLHASAPAANHADYLPLNWLPVGSTVTMHSTQDCAITSSFLSLSNPAQWHSRLIQWRSGMPTPHRRMRRWLSAWRKRAHSPLGTTGTQGATWLPSKEAASLKRDEEIKAQQDVDKVAYEKRLQEAERRRLGVAK